MKDDFSEVASLLNEYFDGLHFSDTTRLARVFHPKAHYVLVTEGTLLLRTMDEYFPIVDARPSPASRGEKRTDQIVSIDFAGAVTATARLNCTIGERYFTDCLTLIKLGGRWQVISKVFHYDLPNS